METIITICLLIVIALLVHDKIIIKNTREQKPTQKKAHPQRRNMMGQPKTVSSPTVLNTTNQSSLSQSEVHPEDLDIEYDVNENLVHQIPKEQLDAAFRNTPYFEEEEEEWYINAQVNTTGFAQGVTFDELSSVGALLHKEKLNSTQKETAIAIVQKIHGTELFHLLESSIEGASQKITQLLDHSLSGETKNQSTTFRKNDLDEFDIEKFI